MEELFLSSQEIVREAGKILKTEFYRPKQVETKSVAFDLVTETDKKIESYLISEFSKLLPGSEFLAEESDPSIKEAEYLWVIDPIDGTTNFVHQFPFVCISVAFCHNQKPMFGMVYNPILNEFFSAFQGKGAFLNEERIDVSANDDLSKAFLGTGFAYNVGTAKENNIRYFEKMITRVHGIRRPGSAALDLCYVAKGVYDGFWEWYLNPWDVMAGILIIQEAGGKVTTLGNKNWEPGDINIAASNKILHDKLLESLNHGEE